jgi:hypothetical protein
MLNITAYANARPYSYTAGGKIRLDGWGKPRQTIYLNETKQFYSKLNNYKDIAEYQTDFMDMLENLIYKYPKWAVDNNWGNTKLDKLYNDPKPYTTHELIKETKEHYKDAKDPILSMILRQQYLIRKLATQFDDPSIINTWDITLTLKNPNDPVLHKFQEKGVLGKTLTTSNSFSNLFGV